MERVDQRTVVASWLERRGRSADVGSNLHPMVAERMLVSELLCRFPYEASFIWEHPVEWYETTLSEAAFRELRVIEGPDGESWRKLSPDHTVLGAARRIAEEDIREPVDDVNVAHVRELAGRFDAGGSREPLVLFKPAWDAAPYVADGNHRATAAALHLLQTNEYVPQPAFLAVRQYVHLDD